MINDTEFSTTPHIQTKQTNNKSLTRLFEIIVFICWFVHLALLWIYRFVPSIDYPDWLLQANILVHYGDFFQSYEILAIPIPNAGFVLPTAVLAVYLPIEIAGKIVLSIYVIWLPLAVRSFYRAINNRSIFWMIGILLLFNVSFIFGNFAFLIGLCFLLTTLSVWENNRKQFSTPAILISLFLTTILFFLHAVCAIVFLIYLIILLTFHNPGKRGNAIYAINIIILISLGSWYYFAHTSDKFTNDIIWGFIPRSRASLLLKSFIAGWSFPPYEFSFLRTTGTFLMLVGTIAIGYISLRKAIPFTNKSPIAKLIIAILVLMVIAPNVVMGNTEMPQRLAIICFILLSVYFLPFRTNRIHVLAPLAIFIAFVTIIRWQDYKNSSLMIERRHQFLQAFITSPSSILTFDDDLGANKSAIFHLVPKGMHFIFQSDYLVMDAGYTPLTFRSGFVIPRDNFFHTLDSLTERCTPEGMIKLSCSDIPPKIDFIILDGSSDWIKSMARNFQPIFMETAKRELERGIFTIILKK
jgi:hypothetical protein